MITWLIVALTLYLTIAVGITRALMPRQYRALRTPSNGVQMPEADAKREAIKLSAQNGFLWPLFAVTGAFMVPLVVVFDGVPWAAKQTKTGLVAAAHAAAPALAPVTGWATKPLALEVKREEALALAARAEEPIEDEPLIPDAIARWEPPVKRQVVHGHDPFCDPVVIEYVNRELEMARVRQAQAKRNARREEA